MKKRNHDIIARLSGLAIALVVAVGAQAQETIITHKGQTIRDAEIVTETFKEVVYRPKGVSITQTLEASQVKEIRHDDTPEAYGRALEARKRGEYENAIQSFRLAIEKGTRPWVEEYCLYEIGDTYRIWGQGDSSKLQRAIDTYTEFKSKFGQSRFLPSAEIGIGHCLSKAGKHAEAEQHFTAIENTARDTYGVEWEIEAKLGNAQNLESQGKHGEARSKYTSIRTAALNAAKRIVDGDKEAFRIQELTRLADSARLREGICLIRAGNYSEAYSFYGSMISEGTRNKDWTRLGGAYNGRGEALYYQKRYTEAYMDFAQTSSVFFHDAGETAKAIYWLGMSQEAMDGQPSTKSKAFFQDVVAFYPNSEWAAEAKKKL